MAFDTAGIFLGLLEDGRQDADLLGLRTEHIDRVYTGQLQVAVARAKARGELPAALDPELLITGLISAFVFHSEEQGVVDRIVDGVSRPLVS